MNFCPTVPQTLFDAPEGSWTLAILPDTQGYAVSYPDVFLRQTEWIAAHRDFHEIRFAIHLGDITEQNITSEWQLARKAMDHLKSANVPFALALGNHDLAPHSRSTLLNDYFTPADYGNDAGYFEPGKTENSWHEFPTSTGKFLILTLEFAPRDEVLAWANEIIACRNDRTVMIAAHAYLYWDGKRFDWNQWGDRQEYSPTTYIPVEHGRSNDGEAIWQKLVSRHPNVAFVFCGHVLGGGAAHLISQNIGGRPVHQMVTNFQPGVVPDRGFGGGGFLRLLRFLPDGDTVEVRTYSPWFDQWLTEPEQCYNISLAGLKL